METGIYRLSKLLLIILSCFWNYGITEYWSHGLRCFGIVWYPWPYKLIGQLCVMSFAILCHGRDRKWHPLDMEMHWGYMAISDTISGSVHLILHFCKHLLHAQLYFPCVFGSASVVTHVHCGMWQINLSGIASFSDSSQAQWFSVPIFSYLA